MDALGTPRPRLLMGTGLCHTPWLCDLLNNGTHSTGLGHVVTHVAMSSCYPELRARSSHTRSPCLGLGGRGHAGDPHGRSSSL